MTTINSVIPNNGTNPINGIGRVSGGTSIQINGSGFSAVTSVVLDTTPATSFVGTNTTINATIPSHSAGNVNLYLKNNLNTTLATTTFTYLSPPIINSIVPNIVPFTTSPIIINGSNFYDITQSPLFITIGSSPFPITSFTDTIITANTPTSTIGTYQIQVNSLGVGSNQSPILYVSSPTITSIVPNSIFISGGPITINGTSFYSTAQSPLSLTIGSSPLAITSFTNTTISTIVPPSTIGTYQIKVNAVGGLSNPSTITYVDTAIITNINPNIVKLAGSTITITGSNFVNVLQVLCDGIPTTQTVVQSSSEITTLVPSLTYGIKNVAVIVPAGSSNILPITYVDTPTISTIVPNIVQSTISSYITINGTNFYSTAQTPLSLTIGSSPLAITSFTQTTISTIVPPSTIGTYQIKVNAVGGVSNQSSILYVTTPTITSIVPNIVPSTIASQITINGTNFYSTAQNPLSLTIGSSPLAITLFTDTTIVATVPLSTIGTYPLQVTSVGGLSNPSTIRYVTTPIINNINPNTVKLAGSTITITGSNFYSTAQIPLNVTVDSSLATVTSITDTIITATTPLLAAGTYQIKVNAVGGSSNQSSILYVATPTITTIAPNVVPYTTPSYITINGTNFYSTSQTPLSLTIGSSPLAITSFTQTTISTIVPPSTIGTYQIKVNAVGGVSNQSNILYVTTPTITSIFPNISPLNGSPIIINGTNFYSTSQNPLLLTFGSYPLAITSFTNTIISTIVPASTIGTYPLQVTSVGGLSNPSTITYVNTPTITSINPNTVKLAGSTITISGTNFYSTSQDPLFITIISSQVAITTFTQTFTETSITANIPGLVSNTYPLQVNSLGVFTNQLPIIYVNSPTITSIIPNSLFPSGGQITISGTNFYSTSQTPLSLTIGSSPLAITSFTQTSITTTVPASTIGTYPLQVNAVGGSIASSIIYINPPNINSIVPNIVKLAGSTITITGSNFVNVLQVLCDGIPTTQTVVQSSSEITTLVPSLTSGPKNIIVNVQSGSSNILPITYVDTPTIATIVPNITPLNGSPVIINGTNFYSTSQTPLSLTIGSSPLAITSFTQTTISTIVPPSTIGTYQIKVNAVGGVSNQSSILYVTTPTITSIVPNIVPSTIASQITINGTNFYSTAQNPLSLTIGSSPLAITLFTDTTIVATVPLSTIGTYPLQVTSVGGLSNPSTIRYVTTPIINSIVPYISPLSGSTITITGSNFYSTAQIPLKVTFDSSTLLIKSFTDTTILVSTITATIGTYSLQVNAVGGLSNTSTITYVSNPTINSIVPDGGILTGGTPITITGSDFYSSIGNPLSVKIGTSPVTITSFTDTIINGTTNSNNAGIYNTIVNASGGSATLGNSYTYANSPTILSLNPSTGPTIGNVPITISGTNFITTPNNPLNITMNTIGTSVSVPIAINSSTLITVTPPPLPAGAYSLLVSTIAGVASTVYTYFDVLKIDSIVPAFGPINKLSGETVTITGTEFSNVSAVKINSYAMSFLINSPTQIISVFATSSKAGTQTVLLYNTTGNYSPAIGKFTYVDPPTVTSILPNSGRITGGTEVTITGTNFIGTDNNPISVKIGGIEATITSPVIVTLASNTSTTTPIRLIVPPSTTPGPQTIDISTIGGSITLADAFTYISPTITSIVPNIGPLEGNTFIRINGTLLSSINANQQNTPTVTIGTNPVGDLSITDTQITGNTPPGSDTPHLVISWSNISISSIYEYSDELSIRSIYPTGGTIDGGTPIIINGKGFFDITNITIGGNAMNGFTVDPSNTFISAITPPGSIGVKVVEIVRNSPPATTSFYFTYLSPIPDPPYTDKQCPAPPYNATNFTSENSSVYNTLVNYAKNSPNYPWNTSTNPQDVYKSQQNTVYFNTLNQKTHAVKTANDSRITAGLPGNMPYPPFKSQTERLMYIQGLTLTAARNKMTGENPSRPMGVPCSTIYNIINS